MRPWRTIKHVAIFLGVIAIIGYTLFEARGIIAGPSLSIEHPLTGATYTDRIVDLSGTTERVSRLTLNGKDISMSEEGVFREHLVLLPGYNEITLVAYGRFGEATSQTLKNYFIPAWYNDPIGH